MNITPFIFNDFIGVRNTWKTLGTSDIRFVVNIIVFS